MKRILLAFSILAAVFLAGCAATQSEMNHSALMYDKQIAAAKNATPTPIFQMVAIPGKTIELKGVERFSVYNPSDATNKVPVYKAPENAGAKVFEKIIDAGTSLVLGKFGLQLGLAEKSRSISAADQDLLKQLDHSTSFENPFK